MSLGARCGVGLAVLVLLGSPACSGAERRPATRTPSGIPICDPALPPPPGFLPAGDHQVREVDHVGVRQTFHDADGRRIHVTAGISGEIGEGAPLVESLAVIGGWEGRVMGTGYDWVLVWDAEPPCTQRSVGAIGFRRAEFVDLLEEWGVAQRDVD